MRPSILMSSWALSSPLKRSVGPNTDMRSLDALLINSLPWGCRTPDAKRGIDCAHQTSSNRVAIRSRGGISSGTREYVAYGGLHGTSDLGTLSIGCLRLAGACGRTTPGLHAVGLSTQASGADCGSDRYPAGPRLFRRGAGLLPHHDRAAAATALCMARSRRAP